jgi:hypothetical protein
VLLCSRHSDQPSPAKELTAESLWASEKKSATRRGCAKVPPKEEDLEECA